MIVAKIYKQAAFSTQGHSQGPDFGGVSSFKGCRAKFPPGKFKILQRVSEILKNRGSPILEVWARRIYETIKLIENRNDFFSNSLFALDWKCKYWSSFTIR